MIFTLTKSEVKIATELKVGLRSFFDMERMAMVQNSSFVRTFLASSSFHQAEVIDWCKPFDIDVKRAVALSTFNHL